MKRLLVLLVAMLGYFSTYAQEVKEESRIPDFVVTPRFDVNPYAPMKGGYSGFDFGNSSLYTFLDGSVGNFSYSMSNHWFASDWETTKSLYEEPFQYNQYDFIDWLTLSYTAGQFTFNVGKDVLAIGSAEYDYNDVDIHYPLASTFWHKNAAYQWGASVDFTTKEEDTTLRLQFASSPFGERPFASKLFAYSLHWTGEYGCFTPFWSVNFFEYERGKFINLIALGNDICAGEGHMHDAVGISLYHAHICYHVAGAVGLAGGHEGHHRRFTGLGREQVPAVDQSAPGFYLAAVIVIGFIIVHAGAVHAVGAEADRIHELFHIGYLTDYRHTAGAVCGYLTCGHAAGGIQRHDHH
jgi:hypothetical protein